MLLDDLQHIAEVTDSDSRWSQYFPALAAEIEEALLAEQRLVSPATQLHTAITAVIQTAREKKDPHEIRKKILVAKALFGDPCQRLGDDLRALIANASATSAKKQTILHRLSTIATHVEYRGLGEESLLSIDAPTALLPPDRVVDRILWPLHADRREYFCAIAIDGPSREVQSITLGSPFTNALRKKTLPNDPTTLNWVNSNKNCYVASIQVEARSARAAAESQLQRLSEIVNVHNLYTNSANFRVRPEVLVIEKSQDPTVVQVKPSSHFGLSPRNGAKSLTRDRLLKVDGRLRGRLANALESHALALAAGDPRTAIINLWTALEAISGSSDAQSIGRRVASSIAPLVAWRRIDKIVTYLALAMHNVLLHKKRFVSRKIMQRSEYYSISQDDVLEGLAGPNGNSIIMYMLGECDDCPLLRQRLFLAWKSFSNPSAVFNELDASKRRIEWQIQRLYRARNLLVHRGEGSHLIWRLLQNAQYYVSISLSRVLHDLSENTGWDIDSSLDYQSMRFEHVRLRLKDHEGKGLTHGDLLGQRSKYPDKALWI